MDVIVSPAPGFPKVWNLTDRLGRNVGQIVRTAGGEFVITPANARLDAPLSNADAVQPSLPDFIQHAQIADSIPAAVVNAGRMHLEGGNIYASGASSSLGVSSREEDSQIIQTYFDEQHALQQEH